MAKIDQDMSAVLKVTQMKKEEWKIRRFGTMDEIEMVSGSMRFRITVWDEGRDPFIVQWFNDPVPAADFLERLQESAID